MAPKKGFWDKTIELSISNLKIIHRLLFNEESNLTKAQRKEVMRIMDSTIEGLHCLMSGSWKRVGVKLDKNGLGELFALHSMESPIK